MKKTLLAASLMATLMILPRIGSAATTSSGSIALTGTVDPSISMTFVTGTGDIALTGTGTSAATMPFGTVAKYGVAAPSGSTKAVNGTTNWSLTTGFGVHVEEANSASTTYALTAELASAPTTGYSWTVATVAMNATTAQAVVGDGANYATDNQYPLVLTITDAAASGSFANTINFVATAN